LIINQKEDKLLMSSLYDYDDDNMNMNSHRKDHIIMKDLNIDIDDILDDKWSVFSSYLNKNDLLNLMLVNKKLCKLSASKFLSDNKSDVTKYNEKIKHIKEKYSEKELTTPIPPFILTKGSVKAVDLLNTTLYNKLFNTNSIPQEDVIFPYKLYFKLIGKDNFYHLSNFDFWNECCNFLIREDEKTGDIIQSNLQHLNMSDDNLFKLSKIITNKEKLISPNYYSKTCATTGLIIFIIKDVLEYIGVLPDKKTLPTQLLKINSILCQKSSEICDKLKVLDKKFQFN